MATEPPPTAEVANASPAGTKRAAPKGFGSEPGPPEDAVAFDTSKKQRVEDGPPVGYLPQGGHLGLLAPPPTQVQEHSMKVIVPNAKVGSVIGKGGSIIRHIRETSKARVNIPSAVPGENDRVVTITGTQEATQAAFNLIQARVSEDEGARDAASGGYGAPQAQDNSYLDVQPGEIVARQMIPDASIGALIGKGGSTIAGIRTQSGAKVKVSSTAEPGTTERVITIIGTLLQCQIAQQLIYQKLVEEMGDTSYGGGYGDASGAAATTSYADPSGAAAAYGAQGAAGAYGAQGAAGAYGAQAYGAGAYGATDPYAAAAYGQTAALMGQYGMPDPNAAMVGYGAPQAAPQVQGNLSTSEITMPDDAMGRVIGRAGHNINEIRSVSGAMIKVVPKDGISPMRRITLTGTAEQIASATLMIQRMT